MAHAAGLMIAGLGTTDLIGMEPRGTGLVATVLAGHSVLRIQVDRLAHSAPLEAYCVVCEGLGCEHCPMAVAA